MSCPECENIEEIENYNSPFVIRKCDSCGREMKILDPGDHGIGIRVNRGDRFVIPAEWLKISANPLQGTGHFTRTGLEWFAKLIFLGDFPRKKEQIDKTLKTNDEICVNLLNESEMLSGLNVEKLDDSEKVFSILSENKESAEWFAYTFGMFNQITQEAIQERDAQKAAWAMAGAERFRSMLVFKQELEEVIWMGHSAKRLIEILNIWRNNQTNSDEEFWQIQFNQHAYVISQVFSVPVVFIEEKAYIGGTVINRQDARFIDFLFSGDTSNETILIEIKTPVTPILGAKYRNIYKPSAELSGALIQIADYKSILTEQLAMITRDLDRKLSAINPRCLIIAGNGETELADAKKRRSFELFRTNLQNIEIITYDELFKKIEVLATLFNLKKKP